MTAWVTQRSGNYSTLSGDGGSPWSDGGAQSALNSVPGNGDTVTYGGAHAITLDAATIPASGSITSWSSAGQAGTIVPSTTPCAFNVGTITAGTVALCPTGNKTLVITGNVVGGSANLAYCIQLNNAGANVTINGNSTAGSSTNTYGTYNSAGGTLVITGTSTGGSGAADYGTRVSAGANNSLGPCVGGSAATAHGCYCDGGTITAMTSATGSTGTAGASGCENNGGTVTIGTAKGGGVAGASGVVPRLGTTTITNVDNTGVGQAVGGGTIKFGTGVTLLYKKAADATALNFYSDDVEASRNTDPGVANVWKGSGTYKILNDTKTPTKVATSIPTDSGTLEAADIKLSVVVDPGADQIIGTHAGGIRRGGALRGA